MSVNQQPQQSSDITLSFPKLLLVITFFVISFGQLQRIQLANNIAFYAHDFFVSLLTLVLLITSPKPIKNITAVIKRYKWLLMFIVWGSVSLVINQFLTEISLIPWMYLGRLVVYLSLGAMLSIHNKKQSFRPWIKLAFLAGLVNLIIIGLGQYLLVPDLRFLAAQGWDEHFYRLAGGMLDPNFFGMLLVSYLVVWLLKIQPEINKFESKVKKVLGYGVPFIVSGLIAFTYSRSSYLSYFTVLLGLIAAPHQTTAAYIKKLSAALVICFLIIIPFLPRPGGLGVKLSRTETINSRVQTNRDLLMNLNVKDYIIGRGIFVPTINTERERNEVVHARFPDNIFVFLISSSGIIGLLIFLKFIFEKMGRLYRNNLTGFLLLMGILVHSQFNLTLLEPINLLMLILTLSV